jgi:hypothetical protein
MSDIYGMMPYERDVFVDFILEDIEKQLEENAKHNR